MTRILASLAPALAVPRPRRGGAPDTPPRTLKRTGVMGLALALAVAVSAVTAAAASANPEFDAAIYPVEWKGTNTNIHGFSGGGVVIVCRKATFNTNEDAKTPNPTKNSPTLTVHPVYTECRGSLNVGNFPVEARTTGCDYQLHAVPPSKPEGSLDIECEPGNAIEYSFLGLLGCTITVFPQNGLKSLEYKNEPKAGTATQEVTTEAEVSKIKSKATAQCGIGLAEFEGEYRQGNIGSPLETAQLEPPGHPATVVFQGFAEATKAQEAVEVGDRPSAPAVTNVEPHIGPAAGGTSVTVTGTTFTSESVVKFGSTTAASVTVNSETSITAISPAGTGTVDVTVTTASGTSTTSEADRFTYGPTVTKVEPNHGSPGGGSTVTITGTGFSGASAVRFGSSNAKSFTVNSATSITAVSPKGKGTVDVTVTTPAGTSPTGAADQFRYSKK
jgi:IPT/TIG domain